MEKACADARAFLCLGFGCMGAMVAVLARSTEAQHKINLDPRVREDNCGVWVEHAAKNGRGNGLDPGARTDEEDVYHDLVFNKFLQATEIDVFLSP